MAQYICTVCDTIYDEEKEGVKWEDLPDGWVCPVCESGKAYYKMVEGAGTGPVPLPGAISDTADHAEETLRTSDLEVHMADIHTISETGESITEPNAKVVQGYQPVMPTYAGRLKEKQLNAIIDYVKSVGK